MGAHSSVLARRIPWTKEPGKLQSIESQRVGHDWVTKCVYTYNIKSISIILSVENSRIVNILNTFIIRISMLMRAFEKHILIIHLILVNLS